MSPEQYEYVLSARERGETYSTIGPVVGMHPASVAAQMRRGPPLQVRRDETFDAFIIQHVRRMGYRAIAAATGANESSVRRRVAALARAGLIERPKHHTSKITAKARGLDPVQQGAQDAVYLRLCAGSPGGGFPRLSERPAKNGEPIACLPVVWPVQEAA